MGNTGSISQRNLDITSNPQVHSTNSYYGASALGDMTNEQAQEQIRNIQMERLQRAFQKGAEQREEHVEPPHLKSLVSIGTPDPRIAFVNNCYVVSFGLRAECTGTVTVIANGITISQSFSPVERLLVNLPVPVLGDFKVEVTPNIEGAECDGSLLLVSKHTMTFRMTDNDTNIDFIYDKQILSVAGTDHAYDLSMHQVCKLHTNLPATKCMMCLINDSDAVVGTCGHSISCRQCMSTKGIAIQQCPICGTEVGLLV